MNKKDALLSQNSPYKTGRCQDTPQGLRIIPLGGLSEIGMNCMVFETQEDIIIVDCGILFSDLDHFGVEFVIPDFAYLLERKDKIRAYVMTHGHEDHIGALPFAWKAGIQAPVFASPFTSLLIKERLNEHGLSDKVQIQTFKPGAQIQVGRFKIQTVSVNHSIVDSVALFIDTPFGKVIHTGDFKIDPTPYYGSVLDLDLFKKAGQEGTLLLLSDSTNIERHEHSMSESMVMASFEQIFKTAEGLTIIAMFASNVGRMGQVVELAQKMNKKLALSGRGMERNSGLARELGYLKNIESVLIPLSDVSLYPRKDVIILSTGSQAEQGSALIRAAYGEHKHLSLGPGDLILLSSRYIPGNEKAIGRMVNQLFKMGAEVLYESVHEIHVSGHATRPELKTMIEAVKPKYFIPIHGEYRHLVHHAALAKETGMPSSNVMVICNGDVVQLSQNHFEKIDTIEETRVLIEGREGNDISQLVLKDRRHMGEKGVVFSLLVRNRESGRVIAGPEIIGRGLVSENIEGFLMEEAKKKVVEVIQIYHDAIDDGDYSFDLGENMRIELRRFFNANIGKKPTVLPVILDL